MKRVDLYLRDLRSVAAHEPSDAVCGLTLGPAAMPLKLRAAAAKAWRLDEPEVADHGYVLFYRGKVCGWVCDVIDADAHKWCPGVLAVGVNGIDGMIYQATGGNDSAGATVWSIVWNPSLTYQPSKSRVP